MLVALLWWLGVFPELQGMVGLHSACLAVHKLEANTSANMT